MSRVATGLLILGLAACDSNSTGGGGTAPANPDGYIYVPNQADSTLYIYNSRTLVRIDSLKLPMDEPHFIIFDHALEYYYLIGRKQPGQIAKYMAANDSLISVVPVEGTVFPTACALSPDDDTLYVTDFTLSPGRTHRYDVSGFNLAWTDSMLQAGHQTHDLRASSDGRYVISAGYSSDDITILDIQSGNVQPLTLDSARLGYNPVSNNYGPYGVLIDHNNTMAILACRKGTDQIRLVDLVNLTILDSIVIPVTSVGSGSAGPTYMVIHPDNNILFVTGFTDNAVYVVRLSTREVLATIPFETPRPFGIAISDDGSRVYVSCTDQRIVGPGRVYIIDGNTFKKLDSLDVGREPFGIAWRPL